MIYSYDSANQLLIPYNKKKNSTLWSLIQKRPEKMPRANERKEREKNPNPETASLEFLVLSVSIEEKLIINLKFLVEFFVDNLMLTEAILSHLNCIASFITNYN